MTNAETIQTVKELLEDAQKWINKTPGAISISIKINDKDIILAEKKNKKCPAS